MVLTLLNHLNYLRMTNIIQLDEKDLQSAFKIWAKEAYHEIRAIPVLEPISDKIDFDEVKRMTGKSDQWVYQKTMRNSIDPLPFKKFNRRLVFSRKAIQEYIDSHTTAPASLDAIMTAKLAESAKNKKGLSK